MKPGISRHPGGACAGLDPVAGVRLRRNDEKGLVQSFLNIFMAAAE